jgi:lipoic acid synthetase
MPGAPSDPRPGASGPRPQRSHPPGRPGRKPAWLKHKAPAPRQYRATGALLDELGLHTVCEEARCPNKGECFAAGTATFLILGDACTRACRFCSVEHASAGESPPGGDPATAAAALCRVDADEPARVALAAARLGLRHVVVTSVTRDDLPDGGAAHFAATVAAVRTLSSGATVEVLIPDLGGDGAALRAVLAARPDVLGHNLETVPRLYPEARPQAVYERSLELLRRAAVWARSEAAPDEAWGQAARSEAALDEAVRDEAARSDVRVAPPPDPAARQTGGGPGPRRQASGGPGPRRLPAAGRPLVKTGLMVGLGETAAEVDEVLRDAAAAGVDLVTVGQYLQPRRECLPVARYAEPAEFASWQRRGAELGLAVTAAPFVRSSYRAGEVLHGPATDQREDPHGPAAADRGEGRA